MPEHVFHPSYVSFPQSESLPDTGLYLYTEAILAGSQIEAQGLSAQCFDRLTDKAEGDGGYQHRDKPRYTEVDDQP